MIPQPLTPNDLAKLFAPPSVPVPIAPVLPPPRDIIAPSSASGGSNGWIWMGVGVIVLGVVIYAIHVTNERDQLMEELLLYRKSDQTPIATELNRFSFHNHKIQNNVSANIKQDGSAEPTDTVNS